MKLSVYAFQMFWQCEETGEIRRAAIPHCRFRTVAHKGCGWFYTEHGVIASRLRAKIMSQ